MPCIPQLQTLVFMYTQNSVTQPVIEMWKFNLATTTKKSTAKIIDVVSNY